MSQDDQRFVPDSYLALHRTPGGRLGEAQATVLARYEWCEDMAQMLAAPARDLGHQIGADHLEAATHVVRVASANNTALTESEWGWVTLRVAELAGA